MRTVIEEPDHFGHDPFNSFNRNLVQRWINVRDLETVFAKHGKADEKGKVVLDLTSLGYDKLLGGGAISGAYAIKVAKVSESAKSKIEAAGGEVITDEQHDDK
jgi:large subunit ribosomal protein L15